MKSFLFPDDTETQLPACSTNRLMLRLLSGDSSLDSFEMFSRRGRNDFDRDTVLDGKCKWVVCEGQRAKGTNGQGRNARNERSSRSDGSTVGGKEYRVTLSDKKKA